MGGRFERVIELFATTLTDAVGKLHGHRHSNRRAVDLVDLLAVHEPGKALLGPEDTVGVEFLGGLAALEDLLA